jgi:hypothetical protein
MGMGVSALVLMLVRVLVLRIRRLVLCDQRRLVVQVGEWARKGDWGER